MHQALDIFQVAELLVKFRLNVGKNVKHHGNDDVKDYPLDKDVEDHKVDAWPICTSCIYHGVGDGGPVVDNHEGIQGRNTGAQVVKVDHIVEVVGDATLAVEVGLLDLATHTVHAKNGKDVVDDVEAGKLRQQRRSHLHNHVSDDLE